MREIEHLQKQWRESVSLRGFQASLSLEKDGLALGTTMLLARHNETGALEIEGEETKLLTLLSVAYGRPVDASILGAVHRASKHACAGDEAMAAMHIALAGLPRLADPADAARRIFIADGLLAMGVRPHDIFAALGFDPAPLDVLGKLFNPEEPRNPAGSGRVSGEWTSEAEEAIETAVEAAARAASRLAPIAARAASAVAEVPGAVALLAASVPLIISTSATGKRTEGSVQGRPDLRFAWNEDGTDLRIFRESDNQTVLTATLTPDGKLRVGPQLVGRKRGDTVVIDPFLLPPELPMSDEDDDRRMCPKESLDRPGRSGDKGKKDKNYEDQMKRWVNPGNPTPRGFGYAFFNPETGRIIIFDDCQKRSGSLFDAKGTGYAKLLNSKHDELREGVGGKLIKEALSQIAASQGRQIYWCFAERDAAKLVEKLFYDSKIEELERIHFLYMPPEEDAR